MTLVDSQLIGPAVAFGKDVIDVEARLLSAGLYSPVQLYNAAVDCELSGDSFFDAKHSAIFCTLLGWAQVEGDRQPTATALKKLLPNIGPDDWQRFVYLECSAAGVESYAREVARYSRLRDEAHRLHGRLAEIVGDNVPALVRHRLAKLRAGRPGGVRVESPKARKRIRRRASRA